MLTVVVADDQQVFAEALTAILTAEEDLRVLPSVSSSYELRHLLEQTHVDVVLLEPSIYGDDGIEGIAQLTDSPSSPRVLVVSSDVRPEQVADALGAGAMGWIPKDQPIHKLLHAVRCVTRDETYVPGRLLTEVVQSMTASRGGSHANGRVISQLTQREQDVLLCLVEGLNRRQMSQVLMISPNTVRTHLQNVLHKLGVHSALAAAAFARQAGVRPGHSSINGRGAKSLGNDTFESDHGELAAP